MNINFTGIFIVSLHDRAVGDIYYNIYSTGSSGYFWKSIVIIGMRTGEKSAYIYDNEDDENKANYLQWILSAVIGAKDTRPASPPPPRTSFSFSM
jgi:hypothetical protein